MGTCMLLLSFMLLFGHAVSMREIDVTCGMVVDLQLFETAKLVLPAGSGNKNCFVNVTKPFLYNFPEINTPGSKSVGLGPDTFANIEHGVLNAIKTSTTDIQIVADDSTSFIMNVFYGGVSASDDTNIDAADLRPSATRATQNFPFNFDPEPYGGTVIFEYTVNAEEGTTELSIVFHMLAIGENARIRITDANNKVTEGTVPSFTFESRSFTVNGSYAEIEVITNFGFLESGAGTIFTVTKHAKGLALGDECNVEDNQCIGEFVVCGFSSADDCRERKTRCICPTKYTPEDGFCKDANATGTTVGDACDDSLPCSDGNAECSLPCNRTCTCKEGYIQEEKRCVIQLDEECTTDTGTECVKNAVCKRCGGNWRRIHWRGRHWRGRRNHRGGKRRNRYRCQCVKPYYQDGEECKAGFNAPCTDDNDCGFENSSCVKRKCKCRPNCIGRWRNQYGRGYMPVCGGGGKDSDQRGGKDSDQSTEH